MIQLYDYFRSSSSYRVRIALYLKGLDFEIIHLDLAKGEQRLPKYLSANPSGGVPTLVDGDLILAQSPAILEYLDEAYSDYPLLPIDIKARAYVRQMAMIIACDVHPLNNLKVWKGYVGKILGATDAQSKDWYAHWIHEGFKAYEALLGDDKFTHGNTPSIADICLIPQLYNARRFNLDLSAYPKILKIEKNCMALDAFQKAAPESHEYAPEDLEQIHGKNAEFLNAA